MHRRLLQWLSDVSLLNITLPILMVYLVMGTIAQKYIGLYEATQQFFYAPLFWLGIIPLPGMPIFIGLLALNLTCYVFFKNPWSRDKIGTMISHIGVILLLTGGLYTALFSQTGYIDIAIDETAGHVFDYHQRALTVHNLSTGKNTSIDHDVFADTHIVKHPDLPFGLSVVEFCRNCAITKRKDATEDFIGMAQFMALKPQKQALQNEENMAGLAFKVADDDKTYLVLEGVPKNPELTHNNQRFQFKLDKARRDLPFTIELKKFEKNVYPGTTMAKAYKSDVIIRDGNIQWHDTIEMNKPFRYKGYTIFQSSFIDTPFGVRSVFSVVKNAGRGFPYIAGFAICFGLLIHVIRKKITQKGI